MRITAEELLVLSYPGADRSIRMEDFEKGQAVSRRYRNRRIGEFLKELDLAEGRCTGVPKILRAMRGNGSPTPVFESDEDRTWFRVRLPVHEQVGLEASGQDTDQVTVQDTVQDAGQDNLLEIKQKTQETPQETIHDTIHDTIQDTDQVTGLVHQLIAVLSGEMGRNELQAALELVNRSHFVAAYLKPALEAGLIEMTLPDKPTSRRQRYRRTAAGQALAERIKGKGSSE